MRLIRPTWLFFCGLLITGSVAAQQPPQRDPQAVGLATQALMAMTGGRIVNDVVLTGSATRIAGSDHETGTATLKARGTRESRVDLDLPGGRRAQIISAVTGPYGGQWSGPDGVFRNMAMHNTWADAAWFFPALSSLAALSDPNVGVSYIGRESRDGITVEHLRFSRRLGSGSKTAELTQRLSATEIFLAANSLLPVAIAFNSHPDGDANIDIPTEIVFSAYRVVSGMYVPFRIQKYIHGGLTLDLSVTNVTVNAGLQDNDFSAR